jgi:hypothetical protein
VPSATPPLMGQNGTRMLPIHASPSARALRALAAREDLGGVDAGLLNLLRVPFGVRIGRRISDQCRNKPMNEGAASRRYTADISRVMAGVTHTYLIFRPFPR